MIEYLIGACVISLIALGIVFNKSRKAKSQTDVIMNTWYNECPEEYICTYNFERNQYLIIGKVKNAKK